MGRDSGKSYYHTLGIIGGKKKWWVGSLGGRKRSERTAEEGISYEEEGSGAKRGARESKSWGLRFLCVMGNSGWETPTREPSRSGEEALKLGG